MSKAFRPQRRGAQAGFSLIEAMIAALLLLIVILGVLPLISRGMINNAQGNDASYETNASVDGLERMLSLPFDNIALEVPAGQPSLVAQDVFTLEGQSWRDKTAFDADPQGDVARYLRSATVEQYSASDFDVDDTFSTPLPGGTEAGFIHMKRITMVIQNARHGLSSPTAYRVLTVQTY